MIWTALRRECPVTTRWAYFDHAAVAPLTERARQTLVEWAGDLAENGVVHDSARVRRIEEVRRLAGQLLRADPLDIAFIKNTSEGIGIVAEGLRWQAGDNVVTAEDEYPANLYPWMNLAERGVELRRVPSRDGRIFLDDLRAAIDGRTRLVSLSFVEYASGFRNDLFAVGQLCREKGVLFFVDAIQGLGVLPLDVQNTPIDFLAADGHKWLLGPEGAGLFWVRRELIDRLHPVGIGWNSVIDSRNFNHVELRLKPHAGRWESGSLNVGGILALGASLDLLLAAGIDAIAERVLQLTDYLCEHARRAGVEVYSSRRPGEASGIVSLVLPGDVRAFVRRCRDAGIIVNQRAGRLRVSPHAYNTTEELDRLIALLGVLS
ncbi:MAG TPA: aminotransferase class V-fold PLP-dependent enzyme [Gemmataceae bacterium]|nr:aminotransferase class V-fold PLP-dependent enzyme [Gemmataceae bacterium]